MKVSLPPRVLICNLPEVMTTRIVWARFFDEIMALPEGRCAKVELDGKTAHAVRTTIERYLIHTKHELDISVRLCQGELYITRKTHRGPEGSMLPPRFSVKSIVLPMRGIVRR